MGVLFGYFFESTQGVETNQESAKHPQLWSGGGCHFQEREDLISKNNAIIASGKSNSDEIASALASISEAKETAALEKKITDIINNAGFKNAFVEVENKTIKVVVDKKNGKETDANNIIKAVMEKTNNEYQVEVKFISETWILSWFYIQ